MNLFKKVFGEKRPDDLYLIGRNEQCWCGSGKKYKKCHYEVDSEIRSNQRKASLKSNQVTPGMSF